MAAGERAVDALGATGENKEIMATTASATVPTTTTPPGKNVVLYDGLCRFCVAQMQKLLKLAQPGSVEAVSFQEPGALDRFPGLTHDICMQAMCFITPEGRIYRGCEAAVRALATRPILRLFVYLYYVPGLKQLCDWAYRVIAANRYRIMGKTVAEEGCAGGTCALHFPRRAGDVSPPV
jgi:predicted DCC family thiol-disulfide oxidoreductase YuxK